VQYVYVCRQDPFSFRQENREKKSLYNLFFLGCNLSLFKHTKKKIQTKKRPL